MEIALAETKDHFYPPTELFYFSFPLLVKDSGLVAGNFS